MSRKSLNLMVWAGILAYVVLLVLLLVEVVVPSVAAEL